MSDQISEHDFTMRMTKARDEADYLAVVDWLVAKGWPPDIAAEHVAVSRMAMAGERLPDAFA